MNKNWERTQIDKLIQLQTKKIEKLNADLEKKATTNE
jgi:hypothetical protein